MNEVMRKIKQYNLNIKNQAFETSCIIEIETVKSKTLEIKEIFKSIYGVSVVEDE